MLTDCRHYKRNIANLRYVSDDLTYVAYGFWFPDDIQCTQSIFNLKGYAHIIIKKIEKKDREN